MLLTEKKIPENRLFLPRDKNMYPLKVIQLISVIKNNNGTFLTLFQRTVLDK